MCILTPTHFGINQSLNLNEYTIEISLSTALRVILEATAITNHSYGFSGVNLRITSSY